jgi:hypothetical protein
MPADVIRDTNDGKNRRRTHRKRMTQLRHCQPNML